MVPIPSQAGMPLCKEVFSIASLATASIPYVIIALVSLKCVSSFFRYCFRCSNWHHLPSLVCTFALWITLISVFLLPLDVFMVTYMKKEDGTYKDWADNSTRFAIEEGMSYAYYTLFVAIVLFTFCNLPMVFLIYQEKDTTDMGHEYFFSSWFTLIFVMGGMGLFQLGAMYPLQKLPIPNTTNPIEEEGFRIFGNTCQDSLYFILIIFTLIGMIQFVTYVGTGISLFPISWLKGWHGLEFERDVVWRRQAVIYDRIAYQRKQDNLLEVELGRMSNEKYNKMINERTRKKYFVPKKWYSSRKYMYGDIRLIRELEKDISSTLLYKIGFYSVPAQLIFGIVTALFSVIICWSMFYSNYNRLNDSLGYEAGYLQSVIDYVTPIDYVMLQFVKVFPVDYLFFIVLVAYLHFCAFISIRQHGIRCFFVILLFRVCPHGTQARGLVFLCATYMYLSLALNFVVYSIAPQYVMFGGQHYVNALKEIVPCSLAAPEGECVMTQASSLLIGYITKAWQFGAAFYWLNWMFLVVAVIGCLVATCQSRKSYVLKSVIADNIRLVYHCDHNKLDKLVYLKAIKY